MNNLIADVLRALPVGTSLTTTLMVIDYILCTTPVSIGEEVEVLTHVLDITKLLRLEWGPVFTPETVALALMGQVTTATGNVDKGIATTHKGICKKRASLYNEREVGVCTMAETVRATSLQEQALGFQTSGQCRGPLPSFQSGDLRSPLGRC